MGRDEDIVKLAYSMAVGTHRYQEMLSMLEERFSRLIDTPPTDTSDEQIDAKQIEEAIRPAFASMEPHFANAYSLMESQGRRFDSARYSMKIIESDSRPSALIDADGNIYFANKAAQEMLGFAKGQRPNEENFEQGHFKNLLANLRSLHTYEENEIISIFGIESTDGDDIIKVALAKVRGSDDQVWGHISTVHISWFPETAQRFGSLFKLTPVELEITKAVVTGVSLTELARKRDRSIGTVRHQAKMLLAKLNLRSQTELACLYSGFSKFNTQQPMQNSVPANGPEHQGEQYFLSRPNGRQLEYEMFGEENARPVLFFPSLLGGNALTVDMQKAILEQNIRLIMVWRPGMAGSDPDGPADDTSFARFAEDIRALLDKLQIDQCPVIGYITASMFALAAAKMLPERISGILAVNPIVPTRSGSHLKLIDRSERLRLYLMRHVPKVGKMVVHGAIAKIDSGFDQEFFEIFLKDSPCDQATVANDEIKPVLRRAFQRTAAQGYDIYTVELMLVSSDWEYLYDDIACPIVTLVGEENIVYTPEVMHKFAEDRPSIEATTVRDAGHLLLYQQPELIFKAAAGLIPAA